MWLFETTLKETKSEIIMIGECVGAQALVEGSSRLMPEWLTSPEKPWERDMGHESYQRVEVIKGSSNRALGLVFAAFFCIMGILSFVFRGSVSWWAFGAAALFLISGLVFPSALGPLNRLWTRFGLLLHRITSPVALGVIYFMVITPMGLVRRAFNADPLGLRFISGTKTYWVTRNPPGPTGESLKDQF